jgi:DNA repair protein SbcC/Rad50
VMESLQGLESTKLQRQTLQAQQVQRQAQLVQLNAEITSLQSLAVQIAALPQLEQERLQIQTQLSNLQAGQAFAESLQSLVGSAQGASQRHQQQASAAKMLLNQAIPNHPDLAFVQQVIESGVTLNTKVLRSLQTLLQPFTDQTATSTLQNKLRDLTEALQVAQRQQQQVAVLPLKQQQSAETQQEIVQLGQQKDECDRTLTQTVPLQSQATQLESELQQLHDPKANLRLLGQQLKQETQLQQNLTQLQSRLAPLQQEMAIVETSIAAFAELDPQFEAQQTLIQTHQDDHQLYLRHREEANKLKDLTPQRTDAIAVLFTLQAQMQQLQGQLQHLQQSYDPQRHLQLKANLEQLKQQQNQLQGGLAPQRSQLQDLTQRLQERQALSEQRERDLLTLTQRQATLQFIADARHIYNQSGPRITKYYLAEVSKEADKLFRELLNRDEVTLEWTEDYDIRVRERGHWRSFKSLSGGEQMCAALAVRLALLRVLADINIAFFDEPTTNMDQQRRRQLADAISNLKAFRQLIVISHDDTFEAVTDHVIRIER